MPYEVDPSQTFRKDYEHLMSLHKCCDLLKRAITARGIRSALISAMYLV